MLIVGDVLAVVAGIISACAALSLLLAGMALLFGRRAAAARETLERTPGRSLLLGAALALTAGAVALVLLNLPSGLLKLIGWALLLGLFFVSALGGSGLALLVGERVREKAPDLSAYGALTRGAMLVVVAGLVPLLGWFLLMPLTLLATLGAGAQALLRRPRPAPVPAAMPLGRFEAMP